MTTRAPVTFWVRPGTPVRPCSKCPALIAFVTTRTGASMPVVVPRDKVAFRETLGGGKIPLRTTCEHTGTSHYADCPAANSFRTRVRQP